jgi:hypothetical protein
MNNEPAEARTPFNNFLLLWKNADGRFPFLSALRAEAPK